ncbi:hypothetical protein GAGA_1462 [Paraglaciecola agarilytica NO2]|uniref:Uncharacterized protein n=1 Tax=Paraglaciecola agarilytica NO2 TaxID=1125747 RepID=A0ABQ0I5F5_9ALTE|nr:hypothetical protein GAGA_1462 [Paraglaciecola agarilytica NO2]
MTHSKNHGLYKKQPASPCSMGLLVLPEEFKSVKIEECKNMKGS